MDNFRINITAIGDQTLQAAMRMVFDHNAPGKRAEAYTVDSEHGMIFLWHMHSSHTNAVALPFKMDADGAADFARRWLLDLDYGKQPDHDGDNERGWRLYTETWGKVASLDYSICAVQPMWAMFGK